MLKKYTVRNKSDNPVERGGLVFLPRSKGSYVLNYYQAKQVKACMQLESELIDTGDEVVYATTAEGGQAPARVVMKEEQAERDLEVEEEKDSNPNDKEESGTAGASREMASKEDSNPNDQQAVSDGSADGKHECDICGYDAKNAAGLAAHKRSHESDGPPEASNEGNEGSNGS